MVVGPRRILAWRVLDSQFFGVPQCRRRVFLERFGLEKVGGAVSDYYGLLFDNVQEFIGMNHEEILECGRENAELAAQAAGVGLALNSAYQKTQANMTEGAGKFAEASFSGGLSGAMSKGLTFAGDMMANMATGAKNAAKEHLQKNTVGGMASAHIEAGGAMTDKNEDDDEGQDGGKNDLAGTGAGDSGGDVFAGGGAVSGGGDSLTPNLRAF